MKTLRLLKRILILALLLLLTFAAFDPRLKVQKYTLEAEEITQPVRVALITDLHSCSYGDGQTHLTRAIREQCPDIVLLGGDICDDKNLL